MDKLNVGAGNWQRKGWMTLDNPCPHYSWPGVTPDIELNLTEKREWPIVSGTLRAVFCSHLVEHLFDDQVVHLFAEVYRILEVGGVFRVVCPDRDYYVKEHVEGRMTASKLAKNFCGSLSEDMSYVFLEQMLIDRGVRGAIKYFASLNPQDTNAKHPQRHVNWFNGEKLTGMMAEAGFNKVRKAAEGDSDMEEMRDLTQFDYSHQYMSLYAEAVK